MPGLAETEFCRPIDCAQIGSGTVEKEIEADASECEALARRFGLLTINNLSAKISMRQSMNGLIHLTGRLSADVVQECVVTLESVPATLDEPFEQHYTMRPMDDGDELLPFDDEDAPEPVENGMIDLGEAVAQQLAIALDPYPRLTNAEFDPGVPVPEDDERPKPLAAIAKLPLRH